MTLRASSANSINTASPPTTSLTDTPPTLSGSLALAKKAARLLSRIALGEIAYEQLQFKRHTGYSLNLETPSTFNEKICVRKLNKKFRDALFLQDKFEVRSFVAARVGKKYLTEVFDLANDPAQINSSTYPENFVLKATNSCGPGSLYIHRGKLQGPGSIAEAAYRIAQRHSNILDRFYFYSNEWWYGEIPTRLMVEEFLSDASNAVPLDYKFFVFSGRVHYVQVDFGRFINHTRAIYDRDWKRVPVRIGYPEGPGIAAPANLQEMIAVAEGIAEGYGFLRVDLYSLPGNRIKFGEVTIAPSLGHAKMRPREFDDHLGTLWDFDLVQRV